MFSLQQVVDGVASNNLKWILMDAMVLFNDLSYESIAFKLLTFGVNGWLCFIMLNYLCEIYLKDQNTPFILGV